MTALRAYRPTDRDSIASLLQGHGWAKQYVAGQLEAAAALSASESGMTIVADHESSVGGFVSVEIHLWNHLAQRQGLAVSAERLREGLGALLVEEAERSLASDVVVASMRTRPSTTSVDAPSTWLEVFARTTG